MRLRDQSWTELQLTVFHTTSFTHQCCFYFLQRSPFAPRTTAMMKIMSMAAGDFNFDTVFRLSPSGASESTQEILFPPISYILWIIFVILMPILFTNMLVNMHTVYMLKSCKTIWYLPYRYVTLIFHVQIISACICSLHRCIQNVLLLNFQAEFNDMLQQCI